MAQNITAAALGTFDGLHKAHIRVLKNALKASDNAICVTFCEPPKSENQGPCMLMQPSLKEERLLEMGFKRVVSLNFSEVKDTEPLDFLKLLTEKYGVTVFCCGYNYRFGKAAKGNAATIKKYCEDTGCTLIVQNKLTVGGDTVNSTKIREYIECGETEKANLLLSNPFTVVSRVVDGDKRGRVMGFPTINQLLPDGIIAPKFGVYISEVVIDDKTYSAVTNFGVRPTFISSKPLSETHILGFSGDLYGRTVPLRFIKFLREEQKFSSIEELKAAIESDLKYVYYYGKL